MRLKVTSSGIPGGGQTTVVNAETGEPLRNVTSVRWVHDDVREYPRLVIELDDAEIDAEIEAACTVVHKPAPDEPRLMITSERPLRYEVMLKLRECLEHAARHSKPVVLDDGLAVYQLLDGRWQPLDPRSAPAPAPGEAPERD